MSVQNSQSQRFFAKGNQVVKEPQSLVGSQLLQKHANIISSVGNQGQQSSSSIPKQKKGQGSQSILIPRGTQAPNHKAHLDQSSRFLVKSKPTAENVQPTSLTSNFCNKEYDSIQSVESSSAIQIPKPPTAPVFCASQSKSLLSTNQSVLTKP